MIIWEVGSRTPLTYRFISFSIKFHSKREPVLHSVYLFFFSLPVGHTQYKFSWDLFLLFVQTKQIKQKKEWKIISHGMKVKRRKKIKRYSYYNYHGIRQIGFYCRYIKSWMSARCPHDISWMSARHREYIRRMSFFWWDFNSIWKERTNTFYVLRINKKLDVSKMSARYQLDVSKMSARYQLDVSKISWIH
jgi:hypothetical protein